MIHALENIQRPLKAAAPIMLGYVPLGIPCGILCISAGMDLWMVAVISIFFYSGAGQYMIPNMWLAASPASAIIASVNLVSSRQLLYGTSLAHFCKGAGTWLTFLFGATVTDESFGVNLVKFSTSPAWTVRDALLVNLFSQASWTLANILGALIGTAFSIPTALASFAMTALFICLLSTQKLTRANVVAALTAAAGVIVCKAAGLTGPAILIGAVCGVAFGTIFDKRGGRQNQIARMVHRSWRGLARHTAGCATLAAKNAGGLTPRIMPAAPTAPKANARTPARRTGRSG